MQSKDNVFSNINFLIDICKGVITRLGIQNYKLQPSSQKCRILFSITNMGQSMDGRWSTFPVLIDVDSQLVKVNIIFTFKGKTFTFSDPELKNTLIEYLTMVNRFLRIGLFKFTSSKSFARFENCFAYTEFPQQYWQSISSNTILSTLASYKAFGFGLVKIVDKSEKIELKDLGSVFEICSNRFSETNSNSQKGVVNLKRKIDENEARIEVNQEIVDKISACEGKKYFDLDNLKVEESGKIFYDNTKLKDLEFAIEKAYTFTFSNFQSLMDSFMDLFSQGIQFSKVAVGLIKVQTSQKNVISFKLGFKNIDAALNSQIITNEEYQTNLWKKITSLNLTLYSIKAYPERNLYFDSIPLIGFADTKLDDPKNLLGTGGFGTVFKNFYFDKPVAIKFPSFRKENQMATLERFRQEFLITKYLRHPNIIKVYGTVEYSETVGIVFEYCDNGTLNEAIKEKKPFSHREKLQILVQIANTLSYVHSKGYVHLDIKPHNVFFQKNEPVIADFGLSSDIYQERGSEMKLGCTIFYSPPEQIRGASPKVSSDIWAFGITMYQFLTEQHPFGFLKDYRRIEKNMFYTLINDKGERPKFTQEMLEVWPVECEIMKMCWNISPGRRPSMGQISEKLKETFERIMSY